MAAGRPARTPCRSGPTRRNPYPSPEGPAGRGTRAGARGDRGDPPESPDAAVGQPAARVDEPPRDRRRRSRPGLGHIGHRRRRAARRVRTGPAGSCRARVPGRARRELVPSARGVRDRPNIGLSRIPGKPWSLPRAFVFPAGRMTLLSTAALRPGEHPGRSSTPGVTMRRSNFGGSGGPSTRTRRGAWRCPNERTSYRRSHVQPQ